MEVLGDVDYLNTFDVIHASPPCQHYANVTAWRGDHDDHPDLLPAVCDALAAWGGVWIVENVPNAPLRPDYILCGSQFNLDVRRHRWFETSWHGGHRLLPPCWHHPGLRPFEHKDEKAYGDAMGVPWMTVKDSREAIPPAYTEFLGGIARELLDPHHQGETP